MTAPQAPVNRSASELGIVLTGLELPPEALRILDRAHLVDRPRWGEFHGRATAVIAQLTDRIDEPFLERASRLRIVANAVVGYDNVDLSACAERGVIVTNTPNVLTEATADLTWALILATVRRVPQAERSLRAGEFTGWRFWHYLGADLTGRTLGIFGMGRIGRAVARRAGAFGMRVQYASRTLLRAAEEEALGATAVDIDTLISTSDVLTLHAPATQETKKLLDGRALRRMPRGSYLINTARGALVDEEALVDALREGWLAGAGLDVYEREPVVHPGLLTLDNVVLLPHIGSATLETRTRMAVLAARNVREVLRGNPPLTPVTIP